MAEDYGVPRDLRGAVMVPPPEVQPMAFPAMMATPPVRVPRQKLAVPVTFNPGLPEMLVPAQLVALPVQVRPTPVVAVPLQLVATPEHNSPVSEVLVPVQLLAVVAINPM